MGTGLFERCLTQELRANPYAEITETRYRMKVIDLLHNSAVGSTLSKEKGSRLQSKKVRLKREKNSLIQ